MELDDLAELIIKAILEHDPELTKYAYCRTYGCSPGFHEKIYTTNDIRIWLNLKHHIRPSLSDLRQSLVGVYGAIKRQHIQIAIVETAVTFITQHNP